MLHAPGLLAAALSLDWTSTLHPAPLLPTLRTEQEIRQHFESHTAATPGNIEAATKQFASLSWVAAPHATAVGGSSEAEEAAQKLQAPHQAPSGPTAPQALRAHGAQVLATDIRDAAKDAAEDAAEFARWFPGLALSRTATPHPRWASEGLRVVGWCLGKVQLGTAR